MLSVGGSGLLIEKESSVSQIVENLIFIENHPHVNGIKLIQLG